MLRHFEGGPLNGPLSFAMSSKAFLHARHMYSVLPLSLGLDPCLQSHSFAIGLRSSKLAGNSVSFLFFFFFDKI